MYKIIAFCMSICFISTQAMMQEIKSIVIPDSSYVIFQNSANMLGTIPGDSKYATFFSFDGIPLYTTEHNHEFNKMRKLLDPMAPKPRPVFATLRYWSGVELDPNMPAKGTPRDLLVFSDQHRNTILSFPFKKYPQKKVNSYLNKKLDLSRIYSNKILDMRAQDGKPPKSSQNKRMLAISRVHQTVVT